MSTEIVKRMQPQFDAMAQSIPDANIEFWYARDLQEPLGYVRWENFLTAINRAIQSCESTGYSVDDHFRGVTKMVSIGSGAERPVEDFMLTRYACYLIAMNGDPRKEPIAFAQSYFASETRKQAVSYTHLVAYVRRLLPIIVNRWRLSTTYVAYRRHYLRAIHYDSFPPNRVDS